MLESTRSRKLILCNKLTVLSDIWWGLRSSGLNGNTNMRGTTWMLCFMRLLSYHSHQLCGSPCTVNVCVSVRQTVKEVNNTRRPAQWKSDCSLSRVSQNEICWCFCVCSCFAPRVVIRCSRRQEQLQRPSADIPLECKRDKIGPCVCVWAVDEVCVCVCKCVCVRACVRVWAGTQGLFLLAHSN